MTEKMLRFTLFLSFLVPKVNSSFLNLDMSTDAYMGFRLKLKKKKKEWQTVKIVSGSTLFAQVYVLVCRVERINLFMPSIS